MGSNTVVIFGAGATKACGGPLTNEILPRAFEPMVRAIIERDNFIDLLERFLVDNFHLPQQQGERKGYDYPALPLLLSLVDKAIDLNQPMSPVWLPDQLRRVRRSLEYTVFALLEYELRQLSSNYYFDFLRALSPSCDDPLVVISLNYDIIIDNAMVQFSSRLPEYGCDIATEGYKGAQYFGRLLKIHGSLNWSYCPGCSRLDLGLFQGKTYKRLEDLFAVDTTQSQYSCHGFACKQCKTFVEPVLITPTQRKDYRNPHVARVWALSEQALRSAKRAIIVGYSLPEDDLDVIYLLKRGLANLASTQPSKITIVEKVTDGDMPLTDHPVGRRYRSLFGPDICWQTGGFEGLNARLGKWAGLI